MDRHWTVVLHSLPGMLDTRGQAVDEKARIENCMEYVLLSYGVGSDYQAVHTIHPEMAWSFADACTGYDEVSLERLQFEYCQRVLREKSYYLAYLVLLEYLGADMPKAGAVQIVVSLGEYLVVVAEIDDEAHPL